MPTYTVVVVRLGCEPYAMNFKPAGPGKSCGCSQEAFRHAG
jgi:hypothetical protein